MQKNIIKRGLTLAVIVLFICINVNLSSAVDDIKKTSKPISNGNILYVGGSGSGNYTHIQDAIDNASNGDTVFVYNGTYYENVVVNKSINLIGEDRNSTIIDGVGIGDVITITNDNTLLKNFTIQNGAYYPFYALVKITSNNNTISDNTVIHAFHGIWLNNSDLNEVSGNYITLSIYGGICLKDHSEYNIISKNIIYDAGSGGGIQFEGSNNNTIIDNYVSDTQTGIQIGDSSINTIENNTFFNNSLGSYLTNSYNNLFNYNTIETNNGYGVFIYDANNNVIYHNNFINNSHNALDYGDNTWDDGYPSGGNYYDDYTGLDTNSDGIGDISYNITGGSNQDLFPLIYPYGSIVNNDTKEIFLTIQYALDDSNTKDGHTVYIKNGIYYENLHIVKSINLLGENKELTIIDGSGGKDVINIEADKVTITGFTIQNNNWTNYGAIAVRFSDSARIFKNIIKSNKCGVYLYWSNSNYISNNIIFNNLDYGFSLINSDDNDISKNYLINNSISIEFFGSNHNILSNNIISNNSGGVELWLSYNNKFLKNTFMNNYWDAGFQSYGNKIFLHRNIWRNNYWNRLRFFPKPIFGMLMWGENLQIRIPWLQFDWFPAKEPYDIEV